MFPNQPNHFRQARQVYHLEAELSVAFSFPLDPEKVQKKLIILPPSSFPGEGPFACEITLFQFSLRLWQGLLIPLSTITSAPPWPFRTCDKPAQTALPTKAGLRRGGSSRYILPLSLGFLQNYILQQRLISYTYYYFWKGQFIKFV